MSSPRKRRPKSVAGMRFEEQLDGSYMLTCNEEQAKNADRERLSHSIADSIGDRDCPAAHLAKQNLPRQEHPFDANVKGSGAHDVMEHLYERPPLQRTEDAFRQIAEEVSEKFWSTDKLADEFPMTLEANRKLKAEWHATIEEWALRDLMLENPQEIDVIGTEYEFAGDKTSNGIVSTGKIDRLDRLPCGGVRVVDYKYGEWKGEPNPKFQDSYKDQAFLYQDLAETNLDVQVKELNILYPREPHRRNIALDAAGVTERLTRFSVARERLTLMVSQRSFPVKPGGLCGWCDLARSCPVAKIPRVEDARANRYNSLETMRAKALKATRSAAGKRPSVALGIPVVRRDGTNVGLHDDAYYAEFAERDRLENEESAPRPIAIHATPAPAVAADPSKELNVMTTITQAPRAEALPSVEAIEGVLNLNSWAAKNIADIEDFAFSYIKNRTSAGVGPAQLLTLSKLIARMATRVQYDLTGTQGMQVGAASRALFHVKRVMMTFDAPFGADEAAWVAWIQRVENTAMFLMRSMDEVHAAVSLTHEGVEQLPALFPAAETTPFTA
ncbi:RecB family exonuclease [Leucobacter sp. HY1910]